MIGWLLLGLLLYKRGNDMRLCQKNPFKLDSNEEARTLCLRGNELVWGTQAKGGSHSVTLNARCPEGSEVIGTWHSHPQGLAEPSPQDTIELKKAGHRFMCISSDEELACYKLEG